MSRRKSTAYDEDDEPEDAAPQMAQDEQQAPPPPAQLHPIEAALEVIDDAVRQSQGGEPGSGVFALLAVVAAQIGVKIARRPS